ncbi:MAG: DUF2752 domain-containing protein [Prevotellaceae bacterium]|nr:DUF2752 domain-containing protein [Candidatus Minthosoma caballi]
MNRQSIFILSFIAVVLVLLVVGNPYSDAWFLKCPLHFLTGYQCPLCGMQRQLHALMHFDFSEAWRLNQFLLILYPYFIFILLSLLFPKLAASRVAKLCNSNKVVLPLIALLLLWGVFRNLM